MTIVHSLATLAGVLLVVVSEPITFKDCTASGQTQAVDITPCPSQPCVFSHNITATVKVTFKAPTDSSSLTGHIYGYVLGTRIAWPMPNPDGCKNASIACPVAAGKTYNYTTTLSVPRGTPPMSLVVEWDLIGAGQEKQFCFDFPMQIGS